MSAKQLLIWCEEYYNSVVPRMKTKREIAEDKKEILRLELLKRVELSKEELSKMSYPLIKEELVNMVYYHNVLCEKDFLESKQGLFEKISYHAKIFNPGLPQMLLTSLSQYSRKDQNDLYISDLFVMYRSLENILDNPDIKGACFRKFRNENGLTFFGLNQYLLSKEYLGSLNLI